MTPPSEKSWKDDAVLLFVVLVWGINFPILKAALEVMHPHVLNLLRMMVSLLCLGWFHHAHQRGKGMSFWQPLKDHGKAIAVLGFVGYVLYQLFFIVGVDLTTAGNAAIIIGSVPLWTALWAVLFRVERVPLRVWVGLALVLGGTLVVVVGGTQVISWSSETFLGNMLILGAAMCWAAFTTFAKPLMSDVGPMSLAFLSLVVALPFLGGVAVPYWDTVQWSEVSLAVWGAVLFSGGLSTGLVIGLWNRAVRQWGPSYTSVFGNIVPIVALVTGAVFLGEAIAAVQIVGVSLIIGGIAYVRKVRQRSTAVVT